MNKAAARWLYHATLQVLPDTIALGLLHWVGTRRWPNIARPRTFNERIQYRKLHDHNPTWPGMIDKVAAKAIVARKIGDAWITPTLWAGSELPPTPPGDLPVVVKSAHGSGRVLIIRAENDWNDARRITPSWMQVYGALKREWAYSQITPRLLVEPDISTAGRPPDDYKFFVFGGKVRLIEVDTDRLTAHKRALFDRNWNRQAFSLKYPICTDDRAPPAHLPEMIAAAETLASGADFLRVDLYDLPDHPRFGELTFYPGSGTDRFVPARFDRVLGDMWQQL